MKAQSISLLIVTAALAGCGSASGTDSPLGGGGQPRQSYTELVSDFSQIDAKFDRGNIAAMSDPADLPTSGGALYTGVLGANIPDGTGGETSLIGQMSLTANFQDSAISGNVQNFVDENEATYTGQLTITEGVIRRDTVLEDSYTFLADLDGNLNSASAGAVSFDTVMLGDFYGNNEEFVGGNLRGDITTDTGTYAFDIDGTYFVGEK